MYLIALRAHLGRGKSALDEIVKSVTGSLPDPTKARAEKSVVSASPR